MFDDNLPSQLKRVLAPITMFAILSTSVLPTVQPARAAIMYAATTAINTPPVANDDLENYIEEDSGANVIDVLANDTAAAGASLTISSVIPGDHGQVAIASNGTTLTYTPNPDFHGFDQFFYKVSDGNNESTLAQVTMRVTNTNDLPVATDDNVSVAENSNTNEINVLTNDHSAGDPSEILLVRSVTAPEHGKAEIHYSHSFITYTPHANFTGIDTFTYTIQDGDDGEATATVTVRVGNTAPIALNDTFITPEDTAYTTYSPGVLANDGDVEGDELHVTIETQPEHGSVTLYSDGAFTYTPHANYHGSDQFTYTANDGTATSNIATVFITVEPVVDQPVANNDTNISVDEDRGAIEIDVLANDITEASGPLSITAATQGEHGQVVVSSNGTRVTYTPSVNYYGYDQFEYTISDSNGGTDTATVAVWVNNTNDNPVALDDVLSVAEDSGASELNVLANDSSGVDPNEQLLIHMVTQPAHGKVEEHYSHASLIYTPDPNFVGEDTFTYTIQDGDDGEATATVVVNVTPVNDAPVAVADQATTKKNSALTIKVLANDLDPDQDVLNVISTSKPVTGSISINKDGTIKYTPKRNYTGTDTFTYTVSDGKGSTATAKVTVLIK